MQRLAFVFLNLLLTQCLFAAVAAEKGSVRLGEVVRALDEGLYKKMPQTSREIILQDFKVYKNRMSFKMNRVFFQIKIIDGPDQVLLVNGKSFSRDELRSQASIHKALMAKFSFKRQVRSLLSLFISTAQAEEFLPFPTEAQDSVEVYEPEEDILAETQREDEDSSEENPLLNVPAIYGNHDYSQFHPERLSFIETWSPLGVLTSQRERNSFVGSMNYLLGGLMRYILDFEGAGPSILQEPSNSSIPLPRHSRR